MSRRKNLVKPLYHAVWDVIRSMRVFTVNQVHLKVIEARKITVYQYICALEKGGYVRHIGFVEDSKIFEVVNPVPIAPSLNAKGQPRTKAAIRKENMWRAMKMLRRFTALDLVVHASTEQAKVTEEYAKIYVRYLTRAGYLKPSENGGTTIYAFIPNRNTGPLAPVIYKGQTVFDPNLRKVVWERPGAAA